MIAPSIGRVQCINAVTHEFRSSSRDYAAERTHTPHAVMEAAYARSDLFEKRRTLMESWARYLVRKVRVG